jgi:hydrogenase maturation protease
LAFPGKASDIKGSIHLDVENLAPELLKVRLDLNNESEIESTATREEVLALALSSAHLILGVDSGEFVSLLDPPGEFQQFAVQCENIGCFPVLVGDAGQRNMLLCSPIILYDYPQIASESAGDFFDSTEMDEMLTLRVMTMTDDEKKEGRSADERTRALLDRTERNAREQLTRTHGIIRNMRPVNPNE